MGRVFRAFDTRLQRQVALKVLTTAGGGEDGAKLLAEARSASALNHPNICTVYEVGEHDGRPFIAMEFIDGPSLFARLATGPLPVSDAIRLAWQITDALAHAHERGVIHRDLKTANVMIAPGDRAKVVDFGVAHRIVLDAEDTVTLEMPPAVVGTLASMSPEQIRGDHLDARCDVWAIGVLLHELLTGTRPFEGRTSFELSDRILHGDPASIPESVPARVRNVVRACLARNREARLRDGGEVRVALEGLSDLLAGQFVPMSLPRRAGDAVQSGEGELAAFRLPPPAAIAATELTTFAGRHSEWSRLEQCWQNAQGDSGSGIIGGAGASAPQPRRQVVLIAGEPGIGKSRLTLEFARFAAQRGAAVLMGRCDEEALIAYQPFVEALRHYVNGSPDVVLARDVDAGATHLDALAPEIRKRVPQRTTPGNPGPDAQRFQLFESLVALMGAIASRQPVVLVLDDLHWADKPTLMMLKHLLRAASPARLVVVGTYRDTEADVSHPLQELLAELRKERDITRLPLRGLDEAAVGRVLEGWTEHRASNIATSHIRDGTEGNPFFIVEALQHLSETGQLAKLETGDRGMTLGLPEGVKETIGRRVTRLGPEVGQVLTLAAVIGRDFPVGLLLSMGEVPETTLLDALDIARRSGLIVEVPGAAERYSFTHALIRETLYDRLSGIRRARAHLKVAQTLERMATPSKLPLADLAHHYLLGATAGDPERSIDFAIRAGDHAAGRLAHEEAARFYQMGMQALELRPDDRTVQRLADLAARRGAAFAAIGQWAPAREAYERALDYLGDEPTEQRAEVLLELAMLAFWLLDLKAARRLAEESQRIADRVGRPDLSAQALAWVARERQADGDLAGAIELDRKAIAALHGVAAGLALCHAPLALYLAGRSAEGVELGVTIVGAAKKSGDTGYMMNALPALGLALAGTGQYREAGRIFDEANAFGLKYGVTTLRARAMVMSSGYLGDLFAFAEAETRQLEGRELARSSAFMPPVISAGVDLMFTYIHRHDIGRAEQIRDDVAGTIATAGGWHGWLWRLRFAQAQAEIAAGRGDWEKAIALATSGIAESRARLRRKYEVLGLLTRACALHGLRRANDAIADVGRAAELAASTGDPALELRVLATGLAIEPAETDAVRAAPLVESIKREIADTPFAASFVASEPVALVRKLAVS
jgi:tetratricopeptide (TPR) repeat protein